MLFEGFRSELGFGEKIKQFILGQLQINAAK